MNLLGSKLLQVSQLPTHSYTVTGGMEPLVTMAHNKGWEAGIGRNIPLAAVEIDIQPLAVGQV